MSNRRLRNAADGLTRTSLERRCREETPANGPLAGLRHDIKDDEARQVRLGRRKKPRTSVLCVRTAFLRRSLGFGEHGLEDEKRLIWVAFAGREDFANDLRTVKPASGCEARRKHDHTSSGTGSMLLKSATFLASGSLIASAANIQTQSASLCSHPDLGIEPQVEQVAWTVQGGSMRAHPAV